MKALREWLHRQRYSVWYVTNERVEMHADGLTYRQAVETRQMGNETLGWLKVFAPTGPQDAHYVILPDGEVPS